LIPYYKMVNKAIKKRQEEDTAEIQGH